MLGEQLDKFATVQYTLKERANSSKIRLNVSLQNGLEVTVPKGLRQSSIQKLLTANKDWIAEALDQVPQRLEHLAPRDINFQCMGECWEVEYLTTSSPLVSVGEREDNILLVQGSISHKYQVALALRRWLSGKSHSHLVPWLHELSKEFHLPFRKAVVRGQRTRCHWAKS